MKYLVALLTLVSAGLAQAGDAHNFHVLGFSQDGRFYAYAQSVVQDGSGYPYASAAVVSVADNRQVAFGKAILENESATEAQALSKAIASLNLKKFGITRGTRTGDDRLIRLPTDHSQYGRPLFAVENWAEGGASAWVPKYEIVIQEKLGPLPQDKSYCLDMGYPNTLVKVSLVGRDATDGRTLVLNEDKASREVVCGSHYSVARVTTLGDSLVVVLRYQTLGFEGPNFEYRVVTGQARLKTN